MEVRLLRESNLKRVNKKLFRTTLIILLLLQNVACNSHKGIQDDLGNQTALLSLQKCTQIMDGHVVVLKDVCYGAVKGFYTSTSLSDLSENKAGSVIREAFDILKEIRSVKKDLPLLMDIYCSPARQDVLNPLVIFIHGGGFFLGDKENKLQMELTHELVESGYVVSSLNYRLGAKLRGFNEIKKSIYCAVQDVRAAMRFLAYHAESLNIDPQRIYLAGSSSGAIIAMNAAFMDEDEVFDSCNDEKFITTYGRLNDSGNSLSCPYKIAGVASLWGAVCDLDIIDKRNEIPVLLFHGTDDDILYCESGTPLQDYLSIRMQKRFFKSEKMYGSYAIYQHMRGNDMPVRYIEFEGFKHAPHQEKDGTFNDNMLVVKQEMTRFLDQPRFSDSQLISYRKDEIGHQQKW